VVGEVTALTEVSEFEAWAELPGGSGDLAKILNTPGLQPTSTPSAHISVGPGTQHQHRLHSGGISIDTEQ
jgi:hypothetical protein